jgi:hypothetical protein
MRRALPRVLQQQPLSIFLFFLCVFSGCTYAWYPNFIGDFSFWPVYSEVQTHVGPLILLGILMFLFGSSGRTRTYNPSVNSRLRGLTHHGRVSLSDSKQTLTPESAKPGEASSGAKFVQKFVQLHAEMPAKFYMPRCRPNFGPTFSRGGVYGQTRTRPYSPAQLSRKRKGAKGKRTPRRP